jgi:hypothetical protein
MKFALLGADAQSLLLARAAIDAGHEIAWQGDISLAAALDAAWPAAHDAGDQWEDLFDPAVADAILVGQGAASLDLRVRQVQELARLGRPMLVVHPLTLDVLAYFEIDMARGESGAVIQHFNPLVDWPLRSEAAAWLRDGHPKLGPIEQVVCVRALADRSQQRVVRHFARDVELLEAVVGRLDRIGAHGAPEDAAAYAALSVQLLGAGKIPVRWSVEPPTSAELMRLTLICQRGRATIAFDAAERAEELVLHDDAGETRRTLPAGDPAAVAIERFIAAVEGEAADASTWPAALHAMELADSIEISLRRGRMIDVHSQQLTEHLAFKGTMAAAGCGVLIVLIPLLLAAGWIAGKLGVPVARYWPHALLLLLAAFLGLQFLPKLLYPQPPPKSLPDEK